MATPSIPDGYGRWSQTFNAPETTHTCVITAHFLDDGSTPPDDLASAFRTVWLGRWVPAALDSDWAVTDSNVLVNRGGTEFAGTDPTSTAGTGSFEGLMVGSCLSLRKRTGAVGRAHRGRIFLPGGYLPDSAVSEDGVIDPTARTTFTDNWQGTIDDFASGGNAMQLVGRDPAPPHAPIVRGPVTAGDAAPKVAWLRRRNR